MTPFYKQKLEEIAFNHEYTIRSEERLNALSDKFFTQVTQHGDMYCPCQTGTTKDTICPCKYMRNYGACRCGLYVLPVKEVKE